MLALLQMILTSLFLFLLTSLQQTMAAEEAFINPMKHNIFLITPKNFETIIGRPRASNGVSLLLHFSSKDKKLKKYIDDVYDAAVKEANGIVRFAAIDCATWSSFCKENSNPDLIYPRVVIYPPYPIPSFFLDNPDKKTMIQQALRYIVSQNIQTVNATTLDRFLSNNIAIPKVLLFSNKKKVPVIYQALSNAFSDRLNFGFVNSSEPSLSKKYNVKTFPKLLIFRPSSRTPEIYNGPINYFNVHEWLNIRAETFVKGGGFSHTDSSTSRDKPWLEKTIPEMTGPSHQDICFHKSNLCNIYLTNGNITNEEITLLEDLSNEYSQETIRSVKFSWMWMDIGKETHFRQLFSVDIENTPSFVVVNPHKRLRFMTMEKTQIATKATIQQLLERIVAGDGRFIPFPNKKIPSFAPVSFTVEDRSKNDEL